MNSTSNQNNEDFERQDTSQNADVHDILDVETNGRHRGTEKGQGDSASGYGATFPRGTNQRVDAVDDTHKTSLLPKQKKTLWERIKLYKGDNDDAFAKTKSRRRVMRFFRTPELRETVSDNNAVNELFYDVIFTLALSTVRQQFIDTFLACPDDDNCQAGEKLSLFVLLFGQFWFHAFHLVLYTNRFTTEEFSYNLALYTHMASIVLMAANGSTCTQSPGYQACRSVLDCPTTQIHAFRIFAIGTSVSQFLMAMQFLRVSQIYAARYWSFVYAGCNLFNSTLWVVAAFIAKSSTFRIAIASISLAVYVAVELLTKRKEIFLNTLLPSHFARRMRKFAIVMLTQLLAGVIQPRFNYPVDIWVFLAGVLLMAFLLKILYFDFDQGSRASGFTGNERITEAIWTCANFFLGGCFTILGASIAAVLMKRNLVITPQAQTISRPKLRWILCISIALAIISSCVIQLSLRGIGSNVRRWRKRTRILIRALIGSFTFFIPVMFPISAEKLVWPITAILLLQVILDMYGRQRMRQLDVEVSESQRQCLTGEAYKRSKHVVREDSDLSTQLLYAPHKKFGKFADSDDADTNEVNPNQHRATQRWDSPITTLQTESSMLFFE